jgi:2-polyprenyl-6-methoxyphenol hydroxylase-like FAD-dependent oxidoreductase
VFGDAISSFNPRYGQGMSVAALQAIELHRTLAERANNLASCFLERAARVIETPWAIAAGNDLRMQETHGRRPFETRFFNWYIARLQRAAHRDPAVSLAFHRVANLLAAPPTLLHPRVALRVLRGNLFRPWESERLTAARNRPAHAPDIA